MSVEVLVQAVQVVPVVVVDSIVRRSARRGSRGSTSGGEDTFVSRSASRGSTGSTNGSG